MCAAVIVDVEASRAIRQAEVGAARKMIERTASRFGLRPQRLAGDAAYGNWGTLIRQCITMPPNLDHLRL